MHTLPMGASGCTHGFIYRFHYVPCMIGASSPACLRSAKVEGSDEMGSEASSLWPLVCFLPRSLRFTVIMNVRIHLRIL